MKFEGTGLKASDNIRITALAIAHAWLADSTQAGGRGQSSLVARAQRCLGLEPQDCPAWLTQWSLRLQDLAEPMWQRLDVPRLASALSGECTLAAACYPETAWRKAPEAHPHALPDADEDPSDEWPEFLDFHDDEDNESGSDESDFSEWVRCTHPIIRRWLLRSAQMHAVPMALEHVERPHWATSEQLAQSLSIPMDTLLWLSRPAWQTADHVQAHQRLASSHYRHRLMAKARGGLRLLEVPKQQLAAVQRTIQAQLLSKLPLHEAAHGFVGGRSVHTHANVHVGQKVVCAFDLRDFFHSIGAAQIHALWRTLGYPVGIAHHLTALTTVVTPTLVRERLRDEGCIDWAHAKRLAQPHLAQGASTSPALANLCAFRLDLRLTYLAERFGARYSRYADDLVFSGSKSLSRNFAALRGWVSGIVADEGFALHPDKTRRMPDHARQRITGLVVNERPNMPREQYDLLRAQLHRLALQPSVSQEQFAKAQGSVAWACQAVNPDRQAKLKGLLTRIRAE